MAIKKRRPVSTESLCQCDLQTKKEKKILVTIKEEKKINCISQKKVRNY
jgi:hypothetical protein